MTGQTVLLTGGTGGLGAGVRRRFLADGWRVVLPWVNPDEVADLAPTAELDLYEADLFDESVVTRVALAAAGDPDRPLRAVVNLVGGFASGGRVHETPLTEFEEQLRLNLRATYLVCQATLPHLIDAGGGAITCVSSRAALRPFSGAAGYVTSKLAVLGLVDSLSAEYVADGVRVNAVLPSVIDTPANRAGQPDADHSRWVSPDRIAAVIAFLCSADADAVSGAHVPVYGRA